MQIPTMCRHSAQRAVASTLLACYIIHSIRTVPPPLSSSICAIVCWLTRAPAIYPQTFFDFPFFIFLHSIFYFLFFILLCFARPGRILINRNAVSECMNELKYAFRLYEQRADNRRRSAIREQRAAVGMCKWKMYSSSDTTDDWNFDWVTGTPCLVQVCRLSWISTPFITVRLDAEMCISIHLITMRCRFLLPRQLQSEINIVQCTPRRDCPDYNDRCLPSLLPLYFLNCIDFDKSCVQHRTAVWNQRRAMIACRFDGTICNCVRVKQMHWRIVWEKWANALTIDDRFETIRLANSFFFGRQPGSQSAYDTYKFPHRAQMTFMCYTFNRFRFFRHSIIPSWWWRQWRWHIQMLVRIRQVSSLVQSIKYALRYESYTSFLDRSG